MAYAAGDALITVRGTIDPGEEWSNTWACYQDTGPYSAQDVTDAINSLYEAFATASPNLWSNLVSADEIRFHDLFTGNDVAVTWVQWVGTNGADQLPPECALRVSLQTSTRRGGPFLAAPVVSSVAANGQLLDAIRDTMAAYIEGMLADVAATGAQIGLHSPKDSTVYPLTAAKLGRVLDVQRRRRNQLPEAYAPIALP